MNLAVALSRLKRPLSATSASDTATAAAAANDDSDDPAFAGELLRVGLMDGDIYGPSVPTLMQLSGLRAETDANDLLVPLANYGLKCMSMGFLIDEESAAVSVVFVCVVLFCFVLFFFV